MKERVHLQENSACVWSDDNDDYDYTDVVRQHTDGYRFFCMMVAQRYVAPDGSSQRENEFFGQRGPKRFTRADWNRLSKEDREKMEKRMNEAREKLSNAFENLPSELFFVLRWLR